MKNKFCSLNDLANEADVETFFILPLFADLGYKTANIKPKKSLDELSVKKLGTKHGAKYRPDYGIKVGGELRMIVEAKAPHENLADHFLQPRDYCITLNGAHKTKNPVKCFILSNGHLTQLFRSDLNEPLLELTFKQFEDASPVYKKFRSLVDIGSLGTPDNPAVIEDTLELRKAPLKDINEAFSWCHQFIYKTDNISQGAAFMEFVKIIALKLLSDKRVRDKYESLIHDSISFTIPLADVSFSKVLLAQQEKHTPNPLSSIWFAEFIKVMELEIASKKKKRIFNQGDEINLSPETISGVVEKLEGLFLFGIDADLNGRLFETFLSATMRGKDLGQYFTPRSIVKLGVGLARLKINPTLPDTSDRVYDGCCGTGGFLIDVLADMWGKVNSNKSLSKTQKEDLRQKIANEHIYGADIGRDPNLCRIARLNMYLHGDGGSSIFNVDGLDKELPDLRTDTPEAAGEKAQMRAIGANKDGFFDVVITNPPFAKSYSSVKKKDNSEQSTASRILKQYELRSFGGKEKPELRSNLMFMERYKDLLKSGGRLVTVLDDGILSAKDYDWFRTWIRSNFIINGVVSLPGDAFQRSMARVKTSILILTKRTSEDDEQPNAFMYPCESVGIDDPARARTLPVDIINRKQAQLEIKTVLQEYENFLAGSTTSSQFSVSPDRLMDRLDVKHCLMAPGSNIASWSAAGFKVMKLSDVLEPKLFETGDIIDCATHDETEISLIVRYDGSAEAGGTIYPADTQHGKLFRVSAGNIVVSNIAASYGSIAVVPSHLDGLVVSTEYTVLQVKPGFDANMVWAILRSPVVLSEILLVATGANRTRVKWEAMKSLMIPYPAQEFEQAFSKKLISLSKAEAEAKEQKFSNIESALTTLGLKNDAASTILSAFKPPK